MTTTRTSWASASLVRRVGDRRGSRGVVGAGPRCTDVRRHAGVAPAGGATSTDGPSSHPALRPVTTVRGAATGSAQPRPPGRTGVRGPPHWSAWQHRPHLPEQHHPGRTGATRGSRTGPRGRPGRSRRRLATAPVRRGPWPYVATASVGRAGPRCSERVSRCFYAPEVPVDHSGSGAAGDDDGPARLARRADRAHRRPGARAGRSGRAGAPRRRRRAAAGLAAPPTVPPPARADVGHPGVGHPGVRRAARPRPRRRTGRPAARARRARPAAPAPRADPSRPRAGHARRRLPSRLGPAAARALTCAAGEGHAAQVGRAPRRAHRELAESCRWARST